MDDATLMEMATYRQLRRLPIVRYLHPKTKVALLVAGQPLVGSSSRRCYEDERMFRSILQATPNPSDDKPVTGYIIDLRTSSDAAVPCPVPRVPSCTGGDDAVQHHERVLPHMRLVPSCPCIHAMCG